MPTNQPGRRRAWPRLLPVFALLLVAVVLAACGAGTPPPPLSTGTPPAAMPATNAPVASVPTLALQPGGKLTGLPVGVDADGNFYRGDLNAAVKMVEFSEFQ